ncbi:MAG: hypothetical protein ACI37R_00600 [Candidatus Avigastranaerophilus sp.]
MKKSLKNISKLLLITGCVSVLASNIATAAPQTYDLETSELRSDYALPNKIRLEGDISFDDHGQMINLSLRQTDVQQVLRMFADKAGLNIVFHESAKGTITLDLVDVSLEDAFKIVMKMCNLTYVIKDKTMLVVGTSDAEKVNLTKDNITVLPVKYVDAAYLANFLNANVFSLNAPGISFGPIVTTNADKNELLIFGTENDYILAKKIVDRFDKKPATTTYRVNHTTPFEMAKMICETLFQLPFSGSLSKEGAGGGTFSTQLNANFKMQGGLNAVPEGALGGGTIACTVSSGVKTSNLDSFQAKPSITIYVQPELGTITMIGGSEQQIEMVNEFIVENDRKQPQAYLEITIVALTEEGSRTFNNTWAYQGKHINIAFNSDNSMNIGPYRWHGPSAGSGAKTLTQTISYLIENKKARMLANPKIVLTNGKKSVIDLTQDYVESTTVQILQNQSVGTMSNSSVQKTYNIEEDNGIKVEILPFISPDGYVSLTMKPQYASIYQTIMDSYMGEPYIAATLLQRHNLDLSNVRIKDEETLLIGGLLQEEQSNNAGKIPILGDIPFLGFFFRNQDKTMKKSELLFILTPRIIKDTEDLYDEV